MKKYVCILCLVLVIFSSCNKSHKKEQETPVANFVEVPQEADSKIRGKVETEANTDSTVNADSVLNSKSWKSIVHEESITFYADYIDDPFFDSKLLFVWKDKVALYYCYYSPELYENEIAYRIQPDDTIKVIEFLTHDRMDGTILHVECPDGKTGYIYYHENIFMETGYFFQESIEVDGIKKDVYSISGAVLVGQKEIYALPTAKSEIVCELASDGEYISKSAQLKSMTDDGEWVKVKIEDSNVVGWVPYDKLESGRGGPVIWTPYMKMIWNMFDFYDKI